MRITARIIFIVERFSNLLDSMRDEVPELGMALGKKLPGSNVVNALSRREVLDESSPSGAGPCAGRQVVADSPNFDLSRSRCLLSIPLHIASFCCLVSQK